MIQEKQRVVGEKETIETGKMLKTISSEKRLDYMDKNLSQKQSVKLKTCADVYSHWRAYKRTYKKAPEDGVEFQIDYIDTGLALDESTRSRAPIALALHGAPGSYHDFALLIHHLSQQKVRVIAPNFPEYIATVKTKVLFRHSADEKAAYLRDFLMAIHVNKIDLLVSHSSAIFPTLLILLNANDEAIARQKQQEQLLERKPSFKQQRDWIVRHEGANNKDSRQNSRVDNKVEGKKRNANGDRDRIALNGSSQDHNHNDCHPRHQCRPRNNGSSTKEANANDDDHVDYHDDENIDNDDDDREETFEDAKEDLDRDNNNNNNNSIENKTNSAILEGNVDKHEIKSEEKNASDEPEGLDVCAVEQLATQAEGATTATTTKQPLTNKCQLAADCLEASRLVPDLAGNKDNCRAGTKRHTRREKKKKTDVVVKFDQPIEIKAVALLNPAGHRLPKSMKPTWFKCGSVHVYQHRFGRSLFRKFGPAFLTVVGVPVRVDNMDNVMLSATVMRNSKCQRVSKQLEQLSQLKIPTLLVFSENDKLIEKEIFYEMTQFMKLDSRNFDIFNNEGDIELSRSSMEDWIRVMVFKAGGHYAYSNYAKTVNQAVSELLEKVRNKTSSGNK